MAGCVRCGRGSEAALMVLLIEYCMSATVDNQVFGRTVNNNLSCWTGRARLANPSVRPFVRPSARISLRLDSFKNASDDLLISVHS